MGVRSWATRVRKALSAPLELARAVSNYQLASLYSPPNSERIGYSFLDLAERGYMANPTVFALENRRMNVFAEATLKFRSLKDKHLFGSPVLARFEEPWPGAETGDLLARMIQYADLGGTAYVRDAGDRLEVLRPDWTTIVSQVKGEPDTPDGQYREVLGVVYEPLGDEARQPDFYPIDRLAMWAPTPDPTANFRGMSWLTPVIREVNADTSMSEFRDAFFRNAATANLIVKYAQHVGPDRIKALREMIAARHAGADNAFGTLVFDEGGDPTVVGSNMQGADFGALQAAGETRLASAAGVPPVVAGLKQGMENSEPGEYPVAVRMFIDLTMRPLWRSAVAALAKLIDVPAGAQLWFDTTDISALAPGEQDKASTATQQASTLNTLIMAGFTADSAVTAVTAGDMSLLKHSGLTSVQMIPPGRRPPAVPDPPPLGDIGEPAIAPVRALRPGNNELEHYWTATPEGLAKWADHPHPWTALYHHLIKYLDPEEAKRTAAQWFHRVKGYWPGDQKGDNPVGPG